MRLHQRRNRCIGLLLIVLTMPCTVHALCGGSFMNPISDVCWECIFPIKIAGMSIGTGMTSGLADPSVAG